MRITATGAQNFGQAERQASQSAPEPKAESRALVIVEPQATREDRPMAYRDASFLAHLIATRAQLPQTRAKRRAEPSEAVATYQAIAALAR